MSLPSPPILVGYPRRPRKAARKLLERLERHLLEELTLRELEHEPLSERVTKKVTRKRFRIANRTRSGGEELFVVMRGDGEFARRLGEHCQAIRHALNRIDSESEIVQ